MGNISVNSVTLLPGESTNAQTAAFGALTLAGAGGWKPKLANGDLEDLDSYLWLVSGSIATHTPSISAGRLVFNAVGCPSGAVLKCLGVSGRVYDVTISSTAGEYSAATYAEVKAAFTAENGAGGNTIRIREEGWATDVADEQANHLVYTSTYASPVTLTCETGCTVANLVFRSANNVTLDGLDIHKQGTSGIALTFNNTSTNVTVQDCSIHGTYYDPLGDYTGSGSYANCDGFGQKTVGGGDGGGGGFNGVIKRCAVYDVQVGISATPNTTGGISIIDNEIYRTNSDSIKINVYAGCAATPITVSRNVIHSFVGIPGDNGGVGPHPDVIQFNIPGGGAVAGVNFSNITVKQNVAWEDTSVARGKAIAGFVAFSDEADAPIFQNSVFEGNSLHLSNQHGFRLHKIDGGTYRNNTITCASTAAGALDPGLSIGTYYSNGTITVTDNVCDYYQLTGAGTYVTTGNVTLGNRGATIPYTTAFDGPSFPVAAWADVKTTWSVASGTAGAIGSGRGTYGDVRDETGWSWT